MTTLAFTNLLAVCAVAFLAPLAAAALARFRMPAVVLELVAGIVLGPAVLGWVSVDDAVAVVALLGLSTLLFLAGLELEPEALRGRLARVAAAGFVLSFAIAILAGLLLEAAGVTQSPLFLAIVLSATSLGVVVPVLKDAGLDRAPVGQLVVLGASIADVATIVLLSLLFSERSASVATQAVLVGGLILLLASFLLLAKGASRSRRLSATLLRLQDTTAQIRVRGAILLLVAFVAAAQALGLEVILGAFLAGAALAIADPDRAMTHPALRAKLNAIGYGFLIPAFFVTSGLRFDLAALTQHADALLRIPLFLVALLAVRALPAVLYRSSLNGPRQVIAAGLLRATSLPFLVAAAMIGMGLGLITAANAAGLIAAGLLSVLLFPPLALALLSAEPGAPSASTLRGQPPAARMRGSNGRPDRLDARRLGAATPSARTRPAAPAAGR